MPSPAIIDIDALVQPISEENPVGGDIRLDSSPTSMYSQIKDARNSARAAERNNMFDGDSSEALEHWNQIMSLAPKILSETKDLEVACWYTEALIRKYHFQGLRDGFGLIRQLIEKFWESGIYPSADEDDTEVEENETFKDEEGNEINVEIGIENRIAALGGLNGEGAEGVLLAPIRNAFITMDTDPGPYTLWQYKQALEINRISDEDKRSAKTNSVGFSMETIERAVEGSSEDFYLNLLDDVNESLAEFKKYNGLLINKYCGNRYSPSSSQITGLLDDTLSAINHIAAHKLPAEEEVVEEATDAEGSTEEGAAATSNAATSSVNATLNSRADAFKQLKKIAEFFRKTEPHSPISYILSKAGRWGEMPLDELMNELIPDSSARNIYSSYTGVQQNEDD